MRLGLGLGAGVRARVGAKVRIGSPAWVRVGDGAEFMRGSSTFWHSCGVMALVCEKSKRAFDSSTSEPFCETPSPSTWCSIGLG